MELQLFRKAGDDKEFKLYQVLPKDLKRFLDTNVRINTKYNYALKAIFNDGSVGKWEEVEIIF